LHTFIQRNYNSEFDLDIEPVCKCVGTGGTKEGAVQKCYSCKGTGIQVKLQQVGGTVCYHFSLMLHINILDNK